MLFNESSRLTVAYKLTDKSLTDKLEWFRQFPEVVLIPSDSLSAGDKDIPLLRITRKGLFLEHQDQRLFFHPNMSILRMVNITRGQGDRFLEATGLQKGDTFLDATMGLGSDLLIASWAVRAEGKAIGLESSPIVFALVSEGLDSFRNQPYPKASPSLKRQAWNELSTSSRQIKTIYADHLNYLEGLPDSSVDVIYFDPMFRITFDKSSGIQPVKTWSNPEPIKEEAIAQALRAARRRVVLKERKNSPEFERLGFQTILPNKYNPTDFGIIEVSLTGGA